MSCTSWLFLSFFLKAQPSPGMSPRIGVFRQDVGHLPLDNSTNHQDFAFFAVTSVLKFRVSNTRLQGPLVPAPRQKLPLGFLRRHLRCC